MEPVESFMEMLARAWRDDDKQALRRIFGNAPGHLQTVPDKYRETVLRMIFDKNKGIFKFINSVLDIQAPCINQYDEILKQVFHLLQFIMQSFKLEYEAYILLTKVICLRCIKEHFSLAVKIEASKTFKLLIQLFHAYDLKLDEIVELYKEEKVFIIVVGAIAKYCPKTNNLESLADSIYLKLLMELNEQCKLSGRMQQHEYIKNFKNYFSMKLSDEKLSCNELSLVIYGFGYFSAVYAKYSPLELDEVFQKLSYQTISFPAKKNDVQIIQMLPCYLQAVTQISNYMPSFKTSHLDIAIKLSVFIFENFPELDDRNKCNAIKALKITFKNIYKLEQIFQRQYFDRLFYKRIVWSCSHPLFIDVELQQEIQNLSEHPVFCYKDSLQLWHGLLKTHKHDEILVKNIFKEVISVLFNFVENLNLTVKSQQNKFRPDVSLSHKALNEAHFRYFVNLVDLYVDIFKEVEVSLLQVHVERCLRDIIDETISVFEIAFKIGLKNNIPLTFHALETLEKWSSSFKVEYLHKVCKNVIVYIEPYFAMQPNFEDEKDKSVESLKKKILSLYSSLDQKILMNIINEKSIDTDLLWTKKKLLLFKLHFTDIQFEISFDKFMSRVIELTDTENRRKKISACEFLHVLVTLLLGRKVTDCCFKNLFYVVLKLGCDMDDTVWNLYHPLVIQLTHYLSSKQMIESKVSQEFINSLFDGLSQEFNPSLRDYCGICLKEFVRWMIKQSPGNDSSKSTNFSDLFNRIINFALHQSNNKKLAAVIAFNYLYIILEGSISVINTYWLEFLYAFVKCLEKCNDIRVVSALNNVESVIGVTQGILNAKSFDRRRHIEFSSETLRGATMWLFSQCGVLNAHCREKSMQLFENLCVLVTGCKYVKDFISSCGIGCVNAIALKNLDEHFESINVKNTKTFLRSLDFYIWMFKKKYLTPKCVLLVEKDSEEEGIFLRFFTKFVSKFIDNNITDIIKTTTNSYKEAEELNDSLNAVMLKIIEFTSVVLETEEERLEQILKNLWNKNLNILISRFTLCPRKLGLTSKSLQTLPSHILGNWFRLIMKKLPEPYLKELKENFFNEKTEDCKNFVNISEIISLKKDVQSLGDFVYGMMLLKNCNFYNPEKEHELSIDYSKKIILSIFEGLKVVKMNGYANTKAETNITTYLKDLLRFFLLEYKPELIECVVDLITNDPSFASSSDSTTGYYEEFYEPLKVPIFQCMLKNPPLSLRILDSKLRDSPDKLFALIENLLYFAQSYHTNQSDILANEVIKNCDNYRALLGENDRRLDRFFSLNTIAVDLNPMDVMPADGTPSGLYGWILEEFNKAENLGRKAVIIERFLICMTDETSKQNPDLTLVLWNLRPGNTETWLRELRASEIERSRAVQCLRSLLKMLLVTKSWIVFEGLIKYAAGACKLFAKESIAEHVKSYFTSIVADSIYQLLGSIYQIFQDTTIFDVNERLDILEYFLLPSLEACRVSVVGKFYEHTRVELTNILTNGLNELDQTERNQSLVSRIGSFRIFELMFGRLTSPAKGSVDLLLLDKSLEVRSFSSTATDDKEIVRLLHCAALNCCIAVVGSKGDDEKHAVVFREIPENNILFWDRIVDCERKYNFQPGLQRLTKRIINIRRTPEDLQIPIEPTFDFYFSRYDPTDIDFNKSNNPTDRRQSLSLEEDEFNEHECTAMITGAIIHLSKSMTRLPDVGDEVAETDLPLWLLCFRGAFNTSQDNVRLLLMRIVSNARNVFVPYLRSMFEELAKTVTHYLKENPLNYLVRNILFIFIECKYDLKSQQEVSIAQKLFEAVIDKSMDEDDKVCLYNVHMLEGLVNMWEERLQTPNNLETIIAREGELSIKIVLMLFRHRIDIDNLIKKREVHKLVRKLMFKWQEPTAPHAFETLGWIMRSITDEQRDVLIKDDLLDLFVDMQRLSKDICVRNFYLTFIGCPVLSIREELRQFRDPVPLENDERRAECFEIFLESMTNLTSEEIFSMLNSMNLAGLLHDRVFPCVDVGFRILYRLTFILEDPQLLPYAQVVEVYTKRETLLEHKKMAYAFFMHIYEKRTNQDNRMDVEGESGPNALLLLSRKVLINGTIDPSDEIQDLLLTFWKERLADITSTSQRLYHLFKLYTPEIHVSFAQFFCVMMLDLTTHSPVDNRILFAPLAECWFEDHEVATSRRWERRRKRNIRSAPLFAPSLTGMLECAVVEQGSRMRRLDRDERLQETPAGALAMSLDVIDRLTRPNGPIRIERAPDPSRIQTSHQNRQTSTSSHTLVDNYYERIKQESIEQRESAKINRRYRIGSYPDIEITQSDVVVTLDDLVRQDAKLANDLLVSIICAMAENIEDEAFHREYMNEVAEFCRSVLKEPNDFAPTAMRLVLQTKCTDFDVQDVTRLAKAMGHQILGILLLEMVSIERNKSKYTYQTQSMFASAIVQPLHHNLELSNLYRSIGEYDVVECISRNWILPAGLEHLREGCIEEAEGDWIAAKTRYEMAWEILDEPCRDHCVDGLLRVRTNYDTYLFKGK
ncbi:hypothetical protein TSAR_008822 [Trichomalopsis sarcophagae]|uniref:DNA-dependent protein kinase catalytic subunit CC3 domain-containing protein n=1 Tax=Trichomalopsis sarcophagae TaxID=543379 RepID=A0A232FHU2_9HYME|nr:hypothetical protein TSAR_008822 [Trichomalopsis sarcophagae]